MYLAISNLPTLKPALVLRVQALCRQQGGCMSQFVNEVVEQAVREVEAEAKVRRGVEWRGVQGERELGMGLVAE